MAIKNKKKIKASKNSSKRQIDYHMINVQMVDGSKFQTRSTWGKDGATMILSIDSKTHPAWTGNKETIKAQGRSANFIKKFGAISVFGHSSACQTSK